MAGRFDGRTALVTGAAQGIGAGVARQLAREGAAVAVTDLSLDGAERTAREIQDAGGHARPYRLDVSSTAQIEQVVRAAEQALGTPTLAVTCAGVCLSHPLLDLTERSWDLTLDVNLKGTFFVLQAVARRMVAAGRKGGLGAIASVAGRGGRALNADYAASKAGVISVVRSAALALAPWGITVNAVCPGVVDTPMTQAIHQERSRLHGMSPEESLAALIKSIPLGRIETVDDVANAVAFLLSDEGSYITGQALNVCGGLEFD
jgi:NAD(P)-dependent dehydrogenase (short-subunit alcohol dehydrogenase family)